MAKSHGHNKTFINNDTKRLPLVCSFCKPVHLPLSGICPFQFLLLKLPEYLLPERQVAVTELFFKAFLKSLFYQFLFLPYKNTVFILFHYWLNFLTVPF